MCCWGLLSTSCITDGIYSAGRTDKANGLTHRTFHHMTHVILFDNEARDQLLPLTYLRPMSELRIGILTIREKWARHLQLPASYLTQDYLSEKYQLQYGDDNLIVNASVLPTPRLLRLVSQIEAQQAFLLGEELIAARLSGRQMERLINDQDFGELQGYDIKDTPVLRIQNLWDIFRQNDRALALDYQLLTYERTSAPLSETNTLIGPSDQVFLEPGARVEASTLNTKTGPIYIGTNAEIMEGCIVRGGLALGENSVLKMGAKIYGATTLGPYCKVGGEVNNSVFQGYSNKGHDGFLGNSVIGEWCNLGADTNCSNLKNNYSSVRVWNYPAKDYVNTDLQFCGLVMGDHSKSAINAMFNTGTVVGICSNVFGSGFPPKFIPSFSWGTNGTYRTEKAFETMERVMARRNQELSVHDRLILLRVFEDSAPYRTWEPA